MYRFFYNYKASGDVLFLVLKPDKKATHIENHDKLTAIYNGDELIGVNFFDIGKTMKIHANGMILDVKEPMLECVNSLLSNASLPTLPIMENSGYEVMQIVSLEEHPLDSKAYIVTLTNGKETFHTVYKDLTLKVGEKVVVLTPGYIAYDGTEMVKTVEKNLPIDVKICSEKELKISTEDKVAFRANEEKVGSDFFLGE